MMNSTQLLTKINDYLGALGYPEAPQLLYRPIEYTLEAGGKRLRPVFVLMSYGLFADDYSVAMPCAAAIEVFHNFTLLHDDIMDNAPLRRGRPTVWNRWGENVAILSGDAMIISSYSLLAKAPSVLLQRIMECFNRVAMQVCEGQQYDMDFEQRQKVSMVEYMILIELKTSVLLAGSAMIGAVLGNASENDCKKIYRYALELGLAFQQQDDLLDSYGTIEELGKRIGGDILEGKKTCLMLNAMSRATEEDRDILRSTHLDATLSEEEKIALVKEVYDRYDIPRTIQQQIAVRFERALAILDTLEIPVERTEHLRVFAQNLMGRKK